MPLNTLSFFVFLTAVVILYYTIPKKFQKTLLLAASIVFYLFSSVKAIIYLTVTILCTFLCAKKTAGASALAVSVYGDDTAELARIKRKMKLYTALPIIINVGILAVLKYTNFAIESIFGLADVFLASDSSFTAISFLIPLGISFYTFQSVAYSVDVYRGKFKPEKNLADFALYISFFPQIIQGPIARYDKLAPQLFAEKEFNNDNAVKGAMLILWGLIKKLVIADKLSIVVAGVFSSETYHTLPFVVMGTFAYAMQLYADFSGYMNIATGVAKIFGVDLAKNFDTPYFSVSISDFWRRWHITLGSWLRDYIYIPLGGNRKGTVRKYINNIIVFFISGLWHGAQATFVLWGLYQGVLVVLGGICKPLNEKLKGTLHIGKENKFFEFLSILRTFVLVCFGWLLFRADNLQTAWKMITGLTKFPYAGIKALAETAQLFFRQVGFTSYSGIVLLVFLGLAFIVEIFNGCGFIISDRLSKLPFVFRVIVYVAAIYAVILFHSEAQGGFLYAVF